MAWSIEARLAAKEARARQRAKYHQVVHVGKSRGGVTPVRLLREARKKFVGMSFSGRPGKIYRLASAMYKAGK